MDEKQLSEAQRERQQANLDKMEDGRRATAVAGAIRDVVDVAMRANVTLLMAMYRGGKIDHDMMVGKVAECAALADLLSDLETTGLRGDIAAQREFGNAKTR